MTDGTQIQIEDWKEDYSYIKTLEIGAYPKAKNTSNNNLIENNKIFRLSLTKFKSDEQVQDIFNKLENGKITLEELKEHFYNGKKDEYYLGLRESED